MSPLIEMVRARYSYDPVQGIVYGPSGKALIGETSFGMPVSSIAWCLFYGKWPDKLVDHKDRDRSNNKIVNLREATYSQNGANQARYNPWGFKGISFDVDRISKPWRAQMRLHGVKVNLGRFETAEEAALTYHNAALEHYGEFYHDGTQ